MSDQNSENLGGNGVCGAISGSEVDREGLGGGMTSGGSVVWGPAIAVNGKRPGWLDCDQKILPIVPGKPALVARIAGNHVWDLRGVKTTHIHLPADHPHYRQPAPESCQRTDVRHPMDIQAALSAGMKPWAGGEAAPDDWDGNPVLTRIGTMVDPKGVRDAFTWGHATADDKLRMPHFDIVAYNPKPAPIDWSGELEAVHEDGRTMPASSSASGMRGGKRVQWTYWPQNAGWIDYDTGLGADHPGWRIRNVSQPTPQADIKPDSDMGITISPDLTARMEALVRSMALSNGANSIALSHYFSEARAIVALLPEPVDPDLIEARKLAAAWSESQDVGHSHYLDGHMDDSSEVRGMKAAIERGRALALAGEKEA